MTETPAESSDPGVAGSQARCRREPGSGGLEPAPASPGTGACLSGERCTDVAKLVRQELRSGRPWGQKQQQEKTSRPKGSQGPPLSLTEVGGGEGQRHRLYS